ncbi:MAG TPA: penicillin-binding protein 2 [Clostridia bacterium]|nr:penicillin-binding protein 2 [Clostridia bacterium]
MEKKEQALRITVFMVMVAVIFVALVSRLFYLQVIQNQQFQQLSEINRLRLISIPARRGDILDKNGIPLATSEPVFSISFTPSDGIDLEDTAAKLENLLDDPEITKERIIETVNKQTRRYVPVEIARVPWGEKGWEIVSRLEENRMELPGISIEEHPQRVYPNGPLAGHILGYVGKINEDELEKNRQYQYGMQDWIGKTGVERFAELISYEQGKIVGLRGQDGVRQVEVDAGGRRIQELTSIEPITGHDVVLTIDSKLQKTMENSMDEVIANLKKSNPKAMAAAAVAIDVRTGAILAAASRPSLNPNDFVDGSFSEKKDYYNNSSKKPMFNRVFQGTYPPGSTFKMITAMAALEAGVNPSSRVVCKGAYWKAPYIRCWNVHGSVDLYSALAGSCNTYFQDAGWKAGIDKIAQIGEEFGLGQKTNTLGILNESEGLLPSAQWKKALYEPIIEEKYAKKREELTAEYQKTLANLQEEKEKEDARKKYENRMNILEAQYKIDYKFYTTWQPFDTFNTSIGQGSNNYTIIQLANYVATLANGGNRYRPYLVDRIVSPTGEVVKQYKPELLNKVSVSEENMAHVRKGMKRVTDPGGTAYSLFSNFPANIGVAAKTGTAQTGLAGDKKNADYHGVFVCFAPYDDPEIAFAAIVEYGESGGSSGGHIAKAVFEEYFGLNKNEGE